MSLTHGSRECHQLTDLMGISNMGAVAVPPDNAFLLI